MEESLKQGPPDEQLICVTCGLCCDGTLFLRAHLEPGERGTGDLPQWIEKNSMTEDGKDYFRLPCRYFCEKCTIYQLKRAVVCSSFRCHLLEDFAEGKVTIPEALDIVREAMTMRNLLTEQYRQFSGRSEDICFMQLLKDLGKNQNANSGGEAYDRDIDILQARCNILEALLIRHFRPAGDFNRMIMS